MTSSRQSKTLFIARQTASFLCWGSAVFLYIFSSCIQPAFCAETTETASIKIGMLAKSGKEATRKQWDATAEYLTATIPHSSFEIVPVDFDQVRQTTADKKIDFLITNSGNYVELEFEYGISRIATLKNIVNNIPSTLFGGVIFTTSNRDDISTLHDLVGKSFHAVAPESFGGWLAALREMRAAGINPKKDCKELRFGGTHDAVVRAVIEGIADAGTVRTDTLERMAEEGKIDLSSLKILNAQPSQENFSYLLSTRLYPEWPFAKLKHTSDSLAEKVAIALLSMPADSQAAKDSRIGGWTVPLDYQPVHELYQELDLGPYARHLGPIRLADLIHQHWKSLLVIVSLFCLLFAITLFTMLLNRRLVAAQGEITLYRLHLEKLVENRTAELSSSERKLARAQRIANLGSWEWDIRKNTLLWAKEVYPIFGLSSDNLPDNLPLSYDLFIDLVHPADRKMVVRAFNDAVTRRTKVNLDHRLLLSDGSEKFVNEQAEIYFGEDGIPLKMVGTIQDITARKLLEQEHSRLAKAIEQTGDSIVITDKTGDILYVNPAFERITGYSKEEVLGKNPRILKSGQQDQSFYQELWDTIGSGRVWAGHFINRKKDGALFEEAVTISPILDADGNINNYVAVKRDITDRVELEKQLRQAQKLEAIGTLAGGIAHDFNNILTAILGFGEIVMRALPEGSTLRKNQEEVVRASLRAADLVKQILTFSRRGEQQLQPLSVQLVVIEALKLLRASIPSTIAFKQEIDKNCGLVLADPTQIHQVIMNLCTNAYHAMRETGGVLSVSLATVEIGPNDLQHTIKLLPGPYVCLEVTDTGHGMEASVADRIFEPYFTTKDTGEGTGLGLSLVHGIVKDIGGTITVSSKVGVGSTFRIYLPGIETKISEEEPLSADSIPAIPVGTEHVLVVDDEQTILTMEKLILESLGYRVSSFSSSTEALQAFEADPQHFDLVISDVTMPIMNGAQLAKKMLVARPDIPILFCTGYSDILNEQEAMALGAKGFIGKPIIRESLALTIRKILDAG